MGSERFSLARQTAFSLVPLVVLLAVAEGVARLFPHRDAGATRGGLMVPHPDLIWRLAPKAAGNLKTNELGLRDTAYDPRADVTILLLGDSVSWGDGIPHVEDVYPQRLERLLADGDPSRSYEVINSGVPGYSTFQQAAYLDMYGLALEPDLVILQFCLNDVVERYLTVARYGGDNVFLGIDTRKAGSDVFDRLLRSSRAFERLVRLRQRHARRREAYAVRNLARDVLPSHLGAAWDEVTKELEVIRRSTAREGIPLLLVIAPYRFQLEQPDQLRQPQERLIAYAKARDIPYMDLLPGFTAAHRADPTRPLFKDRNHFSVRGHEVAARLLAEGIPLSPTAATGAVDGGSRDVQRR